MMLSTGKNGGTDWKLGGWSQPIIHLYLYGVIPIVLYVTCGVQIIFFDI
jgi:hypothetical protein